MSTKICVYYAKYSAMYIEHHSVNNFVNDLTALFWYRKYFQIFNINSPGARFSKSRNVKKWSSTYETESSTAHEFVVC